MTEPKRVKPTADELQAALKAMVAEANQAGHRDAPHVAAAQDILTRCEPAPDPLPEHVETRAEERARVKAEKE